MTDVIRDKRRVQQNAQALRGYRPDIDVAPLRNASEARQARAWVYQEWGQFETAAVWRENCRDIRRALDEMTTIPKFFGACQGGRLIGMASLVDRDLPSHPEFHPWLANVYVLPAWRGQGVAGRLVRHVLAWAHRLVPVIYLYTTDQAALYRHLGWEAVLEDRYNGHAITVMRRRTAAARGHGAD